MRQIVWCFPITLVLLLYGCTYEELECEFESDATAWVDVADFKAEYRLGDTIVLIQDYEPARNNGRIITFPANSDLSWRIAVNNDDFDAVPTNNFYMAASVGVVSDRMPNYTTFKVQPIRIGNRYKATIKICMYQTGDYRLHLYRAGTANEGTIPADRHQNCVEMVDLKPAFVQVATNEFENSRYSFSIIP
jgi:hypothetical protein